MKDAFEVKLHQQYFFSAGTHAGVVELKDGLRPRASLLSITSTEQYQRSSSGRAAKGKTT